MLSYRSTTSALPQHSSLRYPNCSMLLSPILSHPILSSPIASYSAQSNVPFLVLRNIPYSVQTKATLSCPHTHTRTTPYPTPSYPLASYCAQSNVPFPTLHYSSYLMPTYPIPSYAKLPFPVQTHTQTNTHYPNPTPSYPIFSYRIL